MEWSDARASEIVSQGRPLRRSQKREDLSNRRSSRRSRNAIPHDWNRRQHDCAGMFSLPVQAFLDYRGRDPCDFFPWDPNRRQTQRFRHRRIVKSDDCWCRDLKLLITDQCRFGQAVAAAKKGVGSKRTQRSGDVFYCRAKEPGSCRDELSRRKNLAKSVNSALAPGSEAGPPMAAGRRGE